MSAPPEDWSEIAAGYERTIGEIPAFLKIKADLHSRTGSTDALRSIEMARAEALESEALPQATVQLLQFVMCAALRMPDGALVHAKAARHHGVTLTEILAASRVSFVVAGVPAFNAALVAISATFEEN